MTTPKVNTIKRGDTRFYVHPEDGEKVPGVTSILNTLPKPFLKFWAAKAVATAAVDNLPSLVGLVVNGEREGAIDYLKRAPDRDTAQAADTGTAAHDCFERMAKGETLGRVPPHLEPFVRNYAEFLDEFQPEFLFMEETVWSATHNYAGSFDALARIEGEVVWIDNKTTRSGVHAEVALQLAAYGHADYILRPDGSRVPLPKGDGAAVVHVRPEGWGFYPIAYGPEIFEEFLVVRRAYDVVNGLKSHVGTPINENPLKRRRTAPTTARRRAAAK